MLLVIEAASIFNKRQMYYDLADHTLRLLYNETSTETKTLRQFRIIVNVIYQAYTVVIN